MAVPVPATLKPRKIPRQARSAATVDAIFQATIQVLLKEGAPRLTTTRVAERAGVSVGTMYQYFPHKKALLYAVLQQHLETVAEAMEAACACYAGQPLAVISDGLVAAYLDAKTRQVAPRARSIRSPENWIPPTLSAGYHGAFRGQSHPRWPAPPMPDLTTSIPSASRYGSFSPERRVPFSSVAQRRRRS